MDSGNHFCSFITLDKADPPVNSVRKKNKVDFSLINNLPVPISVWQKLENNYYLVYMNRYADKLFKHSYHWGIRLDKAFPVEYQNILSSNPSDESFFQVINDELLIICHYLNDLPAPKNASTDKLSADSLRKIMEPSPVSVIITDIKGNIEFVNDKFADVSGYTREEVIGKNPRILKSGNTTSDGYKEMWDTLLAGNTWRGEFSNKRKDGEIYYEYAVISPLRDNSGKIKNYIAFKEDITGLKKALSDVDKSVKFAELGKMTAFVSHQIKTPLSSIKLSVDLLGQNESINDEARRSITIIQKEVGHLSKLLKEVLQFSKQSKFYFSEIDLTKKLGNIYTLLQPMLKARGINFKTNTLDHKIYGDTQQLHSLFLHLLENSIESIDKDGEIEVSSAMREGKCYIYFKDSGKGIINARDIFEPFFTTKSSGAGFGLPIAKSIAEKHNGLLNLFSSKPGETIFELILPLKAG